MHCPNNTVIVVISGIFVWYLVERALYDDVQVVHTVACKREADVEISALFPILVITLPISTFTLIALCEGVPRNMSVRGQVAKHHHS